MMMEEQKGMLESAAATKDMIDTVKKANAVIKENKVDIEQLEQVKEDMDELKDQQAELNDFFKDYADENQEGVEDDLKALEEEMEKEASQNLPMANKEKISTYDEKSNTGLIRHLVIRRINEAFSILKAKFLDIDNLLSGMDEEI